MDQQLSISAYLKQYRNTDLSALPRSTAICSDGVSALQCTASHILLGGIMCHT